MHHRQNLEKSVELLRSIQDVKINSCVIGGPVSSDDIKVVEMLTDSKPPKSMINLYQQMNGVQLSWSMIGKNGHIFGSIDILPFRQAFLGWSTIRDGRPFEGVLWNSEYEDESIRRLRRMYVLESISGEPTFITFAKYDDPPKLFYVEEEEISPIRVEFDEFLSLLFDYAGCQGLREHLIEINWRKRINCDPRLKQFKALKHRWSKQ